MPKDYFILQCSLNMDKLGSNSAYVLCAVIFDNAKMGEINEKINKFAFNFLEINRFAKGLVKINKLASTFLKINRSADPENSCPPRIKWSSP